MNELVHFKVSINLRAGALAGFLDMLRYDRAVVSTWNHASTTRDGNYFVIYLEAPRCTAERWESFGITPEILP